MHGITHLRLFYGEGYLVLQTKRTIQACNDYFNLTLNVLQSKQTITCYESCLLLRVETKRISLLIEIAGYSV